MGGKPACVEAVRRARVVGCCVVSSVRPIMPRRSANRASARPPALPDAVLAPLFRALVVRPIRLAHDLAGDRLWPPLALFAAGLGTVAGRLSRPLLARAGSGAHPVAPLLRFTDLVEGSLGIVGENELLDDGSATRRVSFCPFATTLGSATGFCTSLGYRAGQEAFCRLVPGSRFEVVRTLSQGHSCCEYRFYPPPSGASGPMRSSARSVSAPPVRPASRSR
ncbi:MAG: hypothetical protein HY744_14900 [Deltaproteobacteria bacterium]|nr:hypothetical protein [Deltaproteobacteria bacterium]